MKTFVFWFEFHWSLFQNGPVDNIIQVSIGSGNGLPQNKQQVITWNNTEPVNWCIYEALGGDELSVG